jgi:hypothetical protein
MLLAITAGALGSVARGDDEDKDVRRVEKKVRIAVSAAPNKHWVGIYAIPADEALKAQLDLEKCLVVQQVIPDSPSDKAGIKQYDVLLRFGEDSVETVEDLIKAVGANKDKKARVTIIRAGKKQVVEIKPEERTDREIQIHVDAEDENVASRWIQMHGGNIPSQLFLGPGVLQAEMAEFPEDLTVVIKKSGRNPAEIVVERNDDRWEITDEDLDKLPEDVRPHVARMMGRGRAFAFGVGAASEIPLRIRTEMRRLNTGDVKKTIEELHEELMDNESVKSLREQLDELRKEVQKLKEDLREDDDD